MTTLVGLLTLRVYLRQSQSLKDKRRVVKSFKERTQARHNVAVAEVGDADNVKRADLAVVAVANDEPRVREILDAVERRLIHEYPEAELIFRELEMLYADESSYDAFAD